MKVWHENNREKTKEKHKENAAKKTALQEECWDLACEFLISCGLMKFGKKVKTYDQRRNAKKIFPKGLTMPSGNNTLESWQEFRNNLPSLLKEVEISLIHNI
jgi:hypothetical protein